MEPRTVDLESWRDPDSYSHLCLRIETVTCPRCNARPGRPCRTAGGGYWTVHKARINAGAAMTVDEALEAIAAMLTERAATRAEVHAVVDAHHQARLSATPTE